MKTSSVDKAQGTKNHQLLLKKCLILLSSNNIFCYQNSTGATKSISGRYIRFGMVGSPDILGILPNGQYLGVEVKTGAAVQNKNQKKFHKKINENHGMYLIIRSIDELTNWIKLLKQAGVFDGKSFMS